MGIVFEELYHVAFTKCIELGIPITIKDRKFFVEGFYKSDTIELYIDLEGQLIANSRYDRKDKINSFRDLVALNYYWWKYSKHRHNDWRFPNKYWLYPLRDNGFISIEIDELVTIKEIL